MQDNKNTFILAGNGSYENKGCEAILRGTIKIIRHYFDNPKFIVLSFYSSNEEFKKQVLAEPDESIVDKKTFIFNKSKPARLLNRLRFSVQNEKNRAYTIYKEILPYLDLESTCAVLSLGGDNYSLDYRKPKYFTDLDNLVLTKNKPMMIWGASVGPFSKLPHYEEYMQKHLKRITGIFARESVTVEYLSSIGITKNVYRVADPAFLLDAIEPSRDKFDKKILDGAIGINFSSLMAKFLTNNNLKKWTQDCAEIIKKIMFETGRPIYLIPHVVVQGSNDHTFFKRILSLIDAPKDMLILLPANLSAGETKWIISRMFVFLGARTHSVIAALSSAVPVLSLAYSIKGIGINRDFYDNDNFSLGKDQITPDIIVRKIKELIKEREGIKEQINATLPSIEKLALSAGQYLKDII